MEKQVFITEDERKKCRKVVEAYEELYEKEGILVLDARRFGFVKLQYYKPPYGFDCDAETFTSSSELFEDLWEEWLNIQLLTLARETPMSEMDYEDIFKCLPREKQQELMEKKNYFMERSQI